MGSVDRRTFSISNDLDSRIFARDLSKGVYRSPLEIPPTSKDGSAYVDLGSFNYEGKVSDILSELSFVLHRRSSDPRIISHHPARVVSSVLDWRVENPERDSLQTLQSAVDMALAVRRGDSEATGMVDMLGIRMEREIPDLFDRSGRYQADIATWMATTPALSYETALSMALRLRARPILFIPTAHGAIEAGMDVYLRYLDLTNNSRSDIHVVRFSRNKSGDKEPRVTHQEVDLLRKKAEGRKVVVFHEDVKTYRTADEAQKFFSEKVFPGSEVLATANIREFTHNPRPYMIKR